MDFPLILTILVLATGIAWSVDKLALLPRRRRLAEALIAGDGPLLHETPAAASDAAAQAQRQQILKQPWWLEYSAGFFPVLLLVFIVRSFIVEPFKIPSTSMLPTLSIGDFILVNKFDYGLRLPVLNIKIIPNRTPRRGEVIVFRYPKDESIDYVKRVIGVPGDTVAYLNKRLTINGRPIPQTPLPDYFDEERITYVKRYRETIGAKAHSILNNPAMPPFMIKPDNFPFRDHCRYKQAGVICTVPAGHYFVMGDHRDNSADSRYWGFVPDRNLIGRAFFIWLNFTDLKRIGRFE